VAPARTGHPFGIEGLHRFQRRATTGVLRIDAPHNRGLGLVDRAPAAVLAVAHDVVAVASSAGNAPGFHPADLPPLRLLSQIVKKHAAEQALDSDQHLVHVAIRQRHDAYAPIRQLLVQCRAVRQVAAEAVQALSQHDIEAASFGRPHHVLQAGSIHH
jgi:hypothetical protein